MARAAETLQGFFIAEEHMGGSGLPTKESMRDHIPDCSGRTGFLGHDAFGVHVLALVQDIAPLRLPEQNLLLAQANGSDFARLRNQAK